jgi:hypothetical protein
MIEMIIVFSYSKNNQKKSIDIFSLCCILSLVLLADADEIRVCG